MQEGKYTSDMSKWGARDCQCMFRGMNDAECCLPSHFGKFPIVEPEERDGKKSKGDHHKKKYPSTSKTSQAPRFINRTSNKDAKSVEPKPSDAAYLIYPLNHYHALIY